MGAERARERQAALRGRLEDAGLDALLIGHLPGVRYLTGFSGSAGLLLFSRTRAVLVTDTRYATQAVEEAGDAAEVSVETSDVWERLGKALGALRPKTLAVEADHFTLRDAERLGRAWTGRVEPVRGHIEALRAVKDPEEVEAISRAVRVAAESLDAILPGIRPGQSELAIAGRLEAALRERGSERHPFPTIVASGPRSALPHAGTSERAVRPNELLLLDFGAQVDGYCADLTRTVVVGRADARQREVWEAVRAAQEAALSGLRPGMTGREADALARNLLEARGMGLAFSHSLGHGLGLEVHEDPRLSRTAGEPVPAGAVVTVEPGAYFENWGGVRLEDDVLLTAGGARCLSDPAGSLLELR